MSEALEVILVALLATGIQLLLVLPWLILLKYFEPKKKEK